MIKTIWKKHSTVLITFLIAFVLLAVISIIRPGYASPNNLRVLEALAGILGLCALGQTFVILTGGMDLSIPWILTTSAFLVYGLAGSSNEKLWYAIPVTLIAGVAMGALNGLGIAFIGIAPVIMTMATNIIFQGLLVGIRGGTPGGSPPQVLKDFGTGSFLGISWLFWLWMAVSAAAFFFLYKSAYGRKLYAAGSNVKVAAFSGVNTKLVIVSAYCVSGLMAAAAGIVFAGRLGQMYLGMGDTYQMESISAAAIGGIALAGGRGTYAGTMAGVLILTILSGVLSAVNLPNSAQKIIYGVVLFGAVLISNKKEK